MPPAHSSNHDATRPHIILASNSPRRRELLAEAGYDFEVVPPDQNVECGVCSESGPAGLVAELAFRKAKTVVEQLSKSPRSPFSTPRSCVVLAADTVAECDGFILGKPRNEDDARRILTQLSGREHRVLTGVCLAPLPAFNPLPPGEGRSLGEPGEGVLVPTPIKKRLPSELLDFARELRKTQTDVETFMWSLLRDRRFGGFQFRRQHPVEKYVLDFYCHDQSLAIEIDGGQHNTAAARAAGEHRTQFLSQRGIRVLRFWIHDVFEDTESVLEAIWRELRRGQGTLTPNPFPKGRGEPPTIRVAVTTLRMDTLTPAQLDEYLASGQWEGKAGAFGYQDRLGWVHIVEGSESNVVGLPMELVADMLSEIGRGGEAVKNS